MKKGTERARDHLARVRIGTAAMIMLAVMILGCISPMKPSPQAKVFTLEYPPPVFEGLPHVDETVSVGLFSTARAFSGHAMLYRTEPFRLDAYNYNRWTAEPGNMVADFLVRDLRESGLFKAVFSFRDDEAAFRIEGTVMEFFEDDADKPESVISLAVTLIDLNAKEKGKDIVFQRSYRFREPCDRTPEGLARGMSKAMEQLSKQFIKDVHDALMMAPG